MAVKNIMIVGVGGQGTLLTSRILGGLAILGGYESSISSIREQLEKYGIVNTYILVRPNTIRQLLSADEECLCIAHESAVESLLADSNNDIVIKEFSDIPIVLQRFAVALKGNKNPFVHEFMQALSTPQRTSAPQGVAHAMS